MSKSSKHTTDLDLKDLLSSFMTDISTKLDSFSAKLDSTNAELGSLRDELRSNVATINTRIDNIQEESESKSTPTYVEALKFSPTKQAVSQPSHLTDDIAQSITNCTYPNTPVIKFMVQFKGYAFLQENTDCFIFCFYLIILFFFFIVINKSYCRGLTAPC